MGVRKKIKEHSNIEHPNISEHPNVRTFEHLDIGEHSNIEHFNVQKIANITEHSNMNPVHDHDIEQRAK